MGRKEIVKLEKETNNKRPTSSRVKKENNHVLDDFYTKNI